MQFNSHLLFSLVVTLVSTTSLEAVPIPVEYRDTSWIDAGVPIAIATDPSVGVLVGTGQNLDNGRLPAQSFTTVGAFTLDKIWIKYHDNAILFNSAYTLELRLFEMAAPNGTNLPASPVNLFSAPQTHPIPPGGPNNVPENYAVFDVENVALAANKGYAFMFLITDGGPNDETHAYKWSNFLTSTYAGGSFYRGDRPAGSQKFDFDQIFALQLAPLSTSATVPEPATLTFAAAGLLLLAKRRGRTAASP